MAELEIAFRLPLVGWPRAVFESTYSYAGGRLVIDGVAVLQAATRAELEHGVDARMQGTEVPITLRLLSGSAEVELSANGQSAVREDALRARPVRSAWTHAVLALTGSAAGFMASYLYLLKAQASHSEWALKMGYHMAGWHLLLTFTLFPASVWGQRVGIRSVQLVSLLFFLIHAGIALANIGLGDPTNPDAPSIAVFNALSGLLFLIAAIYGNRAYRDMDPVEALRTGRIFARS